MCELNQFVVSLPAPGEGRHELELKADSSLFAGRGSVEVTDADLSVYVDIEARHGAYAVGITCTGWIEIPCDRCLEPMRIEVDEEYDVSVKYGDDYDESDDSITLPYGQTTLDLAPMAADTVLLAIPLRHVHPDGECNPRMEEIMKLHSAADPGRDAED